MKRHHIYIVIAAMLTRYHYISTQHLQWFYLHCTWPRWFAWKRVTHRSSCSGLVMLSQEAARQKIHCPDDMKWSIIWCMSEVRASVNIVVVYYQLNAVCDVNCFQAWHLVSIRMTVNVIQLRKDWLFIKKKLIQSETNETPFHAPLKNNTNIIYIFYSSNNI